jgi:predicted permease
MLLRGLLGEGDATKCIMGDLREEYGRIRAEQSAFFADMWYWAQVVNVGGRLAVRRATSNRGGGRVEELIQDLRSATRSLRRRPLLVTSIVLTLGLGIAGATAMFSVVDAVLLKDLSYKDPEGLVSVWKSIPGWKGVKGSDHRWDRTPLIWVEAQAVSERATTLDEVAFFRTRSGVFQAAGSRGRRKISIGVASANLLEVLGVRTSLGRFFAEDEVFPTNADPAPVVVLSHEFWTSAFGSDPDVIGTVQKIWLSQREVIGVLPPGFRLPSDGYSAFYARGGVDGGARDVWIPLDEGPDNELLARLSPGASVERAQLEIQQLLDATRPLIDLRGFGLDGVDIYARVETRKNAVTRGFGAPLSLLLGASLLLLVVACVSISGLLIGAGLERRREIMVRLALGAGRARVLRLLLAESALLGLLGALSGLLFAWAGMDALLAIAPSIPRANEIGVDLRVLAFATVCGLGASLVFGLVPAWSTTGVSLTSRGTTAERSSRMLQSGVLTAQVALTTVLLVAGGLFARSFVGLMSVDPGFDPEGIVVGDIVLPGVSDQAGYVRMIVDMQQSLESLSGVTSASAALRVPFGGLFGNDYFTFFRDGELIEVNVAAQRRVLTNYFSMMGIEVIRGRAFTESAGPDHPGEMVVSESLAERFWPGESPIGVTVNHYGNQRTIVGVVAEVRKKELGSLPEPVFYLSLIQHPSLEFTVIARAAAGPTQVMASLADVIRSVDSDITVSRVRSMRSLIADSETDDRFRTTLVMIFAALATLMAAVGVFGVAARGVATRWREIAVRKALGAPDRELVLGVVKASMRSALMGVGLGAAVAYSSAEVISSFVFGIPSRDPATFIVVLLLLAACCTLAAYLPARRVTQIEPIRAMAGD